MTDIKQYEKNLNLVQRREKMRLLQKKIGCVFLKETSDAETFIEKMKSLQAIADEASEKN